jgi:hypothetical protein
MTTGKYTAVNDGCSRKQTSGRDFDGMTPELRRILIDYQIFESCVKRQIADVCSPHCAVCEDVCCRPEYCRENIDSPFLQLLCADISRPSEYNTAQGWLTSRGCALTAGRPPVCYQFNCNTILNALPDDTARYVMRVLSNLVTHIGRRALGTRHLVEIMDPAELKRIKINRFRKRLAEARRALQTIQSVKEDGFAAASIQEDMSKIVPIPRQLAG